LPVARAFLSLGSNLGDRAGYLRSAVAALDRSEFASVVGVSPVYETEPVEVQGDHPEYLNCAVELSCGARAIELLRYCQGVEAALGRSEKSERSPRTVDIDVLLFGDEETDDPEFELPHRGVARAFNLITLADLDPTLYIPGLGPVGELLAGIGESELEGVRVLGRLEEA
jgi:2-amino-4-hydroxy-6-hydroxymethyldihydropteridine diphosphokinase